MTENSDKRADLNSLVAVVREIAGRSTINDRVRDVSLEFGTDEDGSEFIRVLLMVESPSKIPDRDLMLLLESIEDGMLEHEPTFASVRFSEAA